MNKQRESGWYWVAIVFGNERKWIVMEYSSYTATGGAWHHQGCSYYDDSNLQEIDERPIKREL